MMLVEDGSDVQQQPASFRSTSVEAQQSTGIVDVGSEKLVARMPGKERRDEPSVQLKRFRALILQMEKSGHPNWRDEQGVLLEKVSQAELARRTGLTPSYLNSIKYPERSRNTDIGAAKVAQLCNRVGLDVRYFYDGYEGERPYVIYLLDRKREQNQADATDKAIGELRAEFRDALAEFRADLGRREQVHLTEVASLEKELKEARESLRLAVVGEHRAAAPARRVGVVARGPTARKRR